MDKLYTNRISAFTKSGKCWLAMGALMLGLKGHAQYCSSGATSTSDDEIFNVTFGNLNNSSTCGAVAPGPGSTAYKYSNYTTLAPVSYVMGNTYPLSVTVGMCGSSSYSGIVRVWIDYNQNGVFTDPGEQVYTSPYTAFAISGTAVSAPGGITIPATATPGLTRMRVIETESSTAPGPCTSPSWGETEDYTVNLIPSIPFNIGVSALLKPYGPKKCFTVDTIVARVFNYGTATADFATTPATITVNSTGMVTGTYTLAVNSGTIAASASQDYTVTTAYNMSVAGNYNLKAYTTAPGDGYAADDTLSTVVRRKAFFNLSLMPDDTVCLHVPVITNTVQEPPFMLGTGGLNNTATSYPAPYGNYYHGAKHQFLILASELTAAGLTAGNITSIGFNAVNLNSTASLDGLNIGIATTTLTNLTSFQAGVPNAYTATSYMPVMGINRHTLTTPFNWNGTSNIIVETCFNNYQHSNTSSSNVSFSSSNMPFTASAWFMDDYNSTVCSNASVASSSVMRPDIYFDQPVTYTYSWSPAGGLSSTSVPNPTITAPSSMTYTLTSSYLGCTSREAVHIEIKPTPIPNLGSDSLVCSMPQVLSPHITGNSYLWNTNFTTPTLTITAPGQYWVRVTGSNGCVGSDTVKITQGVTPVVTLGPDTGYCQGSSIVLYAGGPPGLSYLWSTSSTASSITVASPGTYSVTVTHPSGCKASDAVNVISKPLPTVGLVFSNPEIFCPTDNSGRALTEGTPSGGTYIGSGVTGNIFNAAAAGQGTYVILYTYTGPNGCSNIARDTLRVYACVGIDEQTNELGLNVYPNPNQGAFTLELSTAAEVDATVQILTVDGRMVYNDRISGNGIITKAVDVTGLADGIYYLKLETRDAVKTYKLLKQ